MTLLIMIPAPSQAYAAPEYTGSNGWLHYSGLYMKKIKGKNIYISLNEYSSKEWTDEDGQLYIFKGKKNEKKFNPTLVGYIKRIKKNKYKCIKDGKCMFVFVVKKNSIVLSQKRTVIKGMKLKGTFKKKKKYPNMG